MAATYTPIASITLGATAASVTFNSIPQTYTDLIIVSTATQNTSYNQLNANFNSDTSTLYSSTWLTASNNASQSGRASNIGAAYLSAYAGAGTTAGNFMCTSHIMNYSNATTNKTMISRAGNPGTGTDVELVVSLWRSTAAITSITLSLGANSFISGSTFNLYGILGANA
jgi:hypothetical protein